MIKATVMTKRSPVFFLGKIGSAAAGEGHPHFFLNRALLRLNPALSKAQLAVIAYQ